MNTPHREFARSGRIAVMATGLIALTPFIFTGALFAQSAEDDAKLLEQSKKVFQPLPKDAATAEYPVLPDRVSLGRKLFFDPRISAVGTGSCVRCHNPALYD